MDTRSYLIKFLEKISKDTLPVKDDIVLLLKANILSDHFVDVLLWMFVLAHNNAKTKQEKEQLEKSLQILSKIKDVESVDRQNDSHDIEELDRMLENI